MAQMKVLWTTHLSALAAEHISMCSGCLVMTEWKEAYGADGRWRKVRRMTEADIKPSLRYIKEYLSDMSERNNLPPHAQYYVMLFKQLAETLKSNGIPTNSRGDVPACSEDGIIYTYFGRVVLFNDVELVNRINMGEEIWPPIKY